MKILTDKVLYLCKNANISAIYWISVKRKNIDPHGIYLTISHLFIDNPTPISSKLQIQWIPLVNVVIYTTAIKQGWQKHS